MPRPVGFAQRRPASVQLHILAPSCPVPLCVASCRQSLSLHSVVENLLPRSCGLCLNAFRVICSMHLAQVRRFLYKMGYILMQKTDRGWVTFFMRQRHGLHTRKAATTFTDGFGYALCYSHVRCVQQDIVVNYPGSCANGNNACPRIDVRRSIVWRAGWRC